jgi:PadR family transcriptional regulator PadR
MPKKPPRITRQTLAVLGSFLVDPSKTLAGSDVARLTGFRSGTLYPILMRLETAGWLKSQWEILDPSELGRPRKRLYELTETGERRFAA